MTTTAATRAEAAHWIELRKNQLPVGTYVKPSGAVAAYPMRRLSDEEVERKVRLLQEKCDRFAEALVALTETTR